MNCPNCTIELIIAERQNVEIDYCPKCRGVWLDRGELDKIVERASPKIHDDSRMRDHDPRDRHDNDQPYKKKKREGFLGDLFDF